ncbi:hypothetical protein HDE_06781 [Halotydeus destructor]|nr:hypothetical protein HDE_06781 [Halotydeus destructor]
MLFLKSFAVLVAIAHTAHARYDPSPFGGRYLANLGLSIPLSYEQGFRPSLSTGLRYGHLGPDHDASIGYQLTKDFSKDTTSHLFDANFRRSDYGVGGSHSFGTLGQQSNFYLNGYPSRTSHVGMGFGMDGSGAQVTASGSGKPTPDTHMAASHSFGKGWRTQVDMTAFPSRTSELGMGYAFDRNGPQTTFRARGQPTAGSSLSYEQSTGIGKFQGVLGYVGSPSPGTYVDGKLSASRLGVDADIKGFNQLSPHNRVAFSSDSNKAGAKVASPGEVTFPIVLPKVPIGNSDIASDVISSSGPPLGSSQLPTGVSDDDILKFRSSDLYQRLIRKE